MSANVNPLRLKKRTTYSGFIYATGDRPGRAVEMSGEDWRNHALGLRLIEDRETGGEAGTLYAKRGAVTAFEIYEVKS